METFVNIVGWFGAALLLIAYALVSTKRLEGTSYTFQLLNVMGGIMLASNSAYHGALPSVVVNFVWIVIGIAAIVNRRRKQGINL